MSDDNCNVCHGTGEIIESDSRLSSGHRYVPCKYCFMSSGKRSPPDFSGIQVNGRTVGLAILPLALFIALIVAYAVYDAILDKQPWWPYVLKTGAVIGGIWFLWLGCRFLGWALAQIVRSPAWLISLSVGSTLYLYGAYSTHLFTAAWQSVLGLGLFSAVWLLLTSFIAPRFVALAVVVVAAFWTPAFHFVFIRL